MSGASRSSEPKKASLGAITVFLFGIPLGALAVGVLSSPLVNSETVHRYVSHPVEQAEIILFCCALTALVIKAMNYLRERSALDVRVVPRWDGKPMPAAEATKLRAMWERERESFRTTWFGKRIGAVLDFVSNRGNANELDDYLRTLSDNEAVSNEGSYALVRFISWAIPILGFLGTVLGITEAITGVTPEMLEKSLSTVTDGLATAFDTTALALFLTMILMFLSYATERLEQTVLESVDSYVDVELGHRFLRHGSETDRFVYALQQNTNVLLAAMGQLVEKQASVWGSTMDRSEKHWGEKTAQEHDRLATAIKQALEATLTRYAERISELEGKLIARGQTLLDGLKELSTSFGEMGKEHQLALARLTDTMGMQVESLVKFQTDEEHLLRLQESLSQNLHAVLATGTFDQTLQSLTAAIHLLTVRVNPPQTPPTLRLVPKPDAA